MKLSMDQLGTYSRDGLLLLHDHFSADELATLRAQLPDLYDESSPRTILEKDGKTVRSVHGSHTTNAVFERLVRHPRMVAPAMQILGGDVYVYQFKINAKRAFAGDLWPWHQDYIFWLKEDGLAESRQVTLALFLDDVSEFNGPMVLIPGSHHEGVLESPAPEGESQDEGDWLAGFQADLKYSIAPETVTRLVSKGGIVTAKGSAGSMLFFHPNVVHGSMGNMSPFDRTLLLVTYCSASVTPRVDESSRPEFLVSRDFAPITSLPHDAALTPPSA